MSRQMQLIRQAISQSRRRQGMQGKWITAPDGWTDFHPDPSMEPGITLNRLEEEATHDATDMAQGKIREMEQADIRADYP